MTSTLFFSNRTHLAKELLRRTLRMEQITGELPLSLGGAGRGSFGETVVGTESPLRKDLLPPLLVVRATESI